MKQTIWLIGILCLVISLGSCASKRKVASKQVRVERTSGRSSHKLGNAEQRNTPVLPVDEGAAVAAQDDVQETAPEIVAEEVQEVASEIVAEEVQEVVQEEVREPERAAEPEVQTMYITGMMVGIQIGDKQLTTPATLTWQRHVGMLLSIQPFAGIELMRIEVYADYVMVIDKMNRQYTRLTYSDLEAMGAKTTYAETEQWLDENVVNKRGQQSLSLSVERQGMKGTLSVPCQYIRVNTAVNMNAVDVRGYRQVTAEQIIRGI